MLEFKLHKKVVIHKDGNKLGLRKREQLRKEIQAFTRNACITISGYNTHPRNEKIWSVCSSDAEEMNSYLITIKEAVRMIESAIDDGEYDDKTGKFYIYVNN